MRPSNRKIPLAETPVEEPEALEASPAPAKRRASPKPPAPRPAPQSPGMVKAIAFARIVLGVVLVVGLSGAVAYSARKYVRGTPRFAVSEIVVLGNKHRQVDEVVALSGVAKGKNVFSTDLDAARALLLADPWIKEAHLERRLPGTVTIVVEERKPAGIVASGETYLVTAEGEIWKKLEPGDPTDLPIVTGLPVQMLTEDRKGAELVVRRALELGAEYERTSLSKRSPLQEIHVSGNGATSLVVGKSALTLELGEAPFRRKLEQASRVVAELDKRGAKPDAILLDDDARPDRVVVRMR